jgi:hypothetical protein
MELHELPARDRLEQYEKQAQDLVEGHRRGDSDSIWHLQKDHPHFREMSDSEVRSSTFGLAEAQLIIARSNYFESWPEYRVCQSSDSGEFSRFSFRVGDAIVNGDVVTLERLLRANPDLIRVDAQASRDTTPLCGRKRH